VNDGRPPQSLPIARTIADLRSAVAAWRAEGAAAIGVVPTMGALHEGHLELVRQAVATCQRVIVTLFVNPKQFNDPSDLDRYPRREADDAELLARYGASLLYAPDAAAMYPDGFQTSVSLGPLTEAMEGEARPGHFVGVATVVAKLLLQTGADRAFFGEKDYQQLRVVTQMAEDLNIPCRIVGVPTVRAEDGLALSSRNELLSESERQIAPALHDVLRELAEFLARGGPAAERLSHAEEALFAAGFAAVDYIALCDAITLAPLSQAEPGRRARLFAAAQLGSVRLIDNVPIPDAVSPKS